MDLSGIVWNQRRDADLDKARPIPDMHIHTEYCNHSRNTIAGVIGFLRDNHLFGSFNEHAPHPETFKRENQHIENLHRDTMSREQMDEFLANYSKLHHIARNWSIPVGLEVDLFKGIEDEAHDNFRQFESTFHDHQVPLNHLSLSHHYLGGYSIFRDNFGEYLAKEGPENVIRSYFDDLCEEIGSFHYEFVCHPGVIHYCINRMGYFVMADKTLKGAYLKGYSDLLVSAKKADTALEINTSGIQREYTKSAVPTEARPDILDQPNPHMPIEILAQGLEQGVKFVVGSDCHSEKNPLGVCQRHQYFDQVYDVLTALGAKEIYLVLNRNLVSVPIK